MIPIYLILGSSPAPRLESEGYPASSASNQCPYALSGGRDSHLWQLRARRVSIDKRPAVSHGNIARGAEGHLRRSKNHTVENPICPACAVFSRKGSHHFLLSLSCRHQSDEIYHSVEDTKSVLHSLTALHPISRQTNTRGRGELGCSGVLLPPNWHVFF